MSFAVSAQQVRALLSNTKKFLNENDPTHLSFDTELLHGPGRAQKLEIGRDLHWLLTSAFELPEDQNIQANLVKALAKLTPRVSYETLRANTETLRANPKTAPPETACFEILPPAPIHAHSNRSKKPAARPSASIKRAEAKKATRASTPAKNKPAPSKMAIGQSRDRYIQWFRKFGGITQIHFAEEALKHRTADNNGVVPSSVDFVGGAFNGVNFDETMRTLRTAGELFDDTPIPLGALRQKLLSEIPGLTLPPPPASLVLPSVAQVGQQIRGR